MIDPDLSGVVCFIVKHPDEDFEKPNFFKVWNFGKALATSSAYFSIALDCNLTLPVNQNFFLHWFRSQLEFHLPFDMKKNLILLLFFIGLSELSAQQNHEKQALQGILEKQLSTEIPGILFHVQSGNGEINWSGAAGVSKKESGKNLLSDQTFRIASVTKTFVAASILRLWEEGKLQLEDPIATHVSDEHAQILRQDYDLDKISILQVLQHNAGFFDHTNAPVFFEKVLQPGGHKWTRTEQLKLCVDAGNPVGSPGEKFSYSDTGYLILGEIIERIHGKNLGLAVPEILDFEKLGLENTAFEGLNPKVDQARIHQYFQGKDTYLFHPSMDYFGGGGLLSTTKDLTQFFLALFKGEVFKSAKTLEKMLEAHSLKQEVISVDSFDAKVYKALK